MLSAAETTMSAGMGSQHHCGRCVTRRGFARAASASTSSDSFFIFQVALGTRCYNDGAAALVHEDDIRCLNSSSIYCDQSNQKALQCYFPPGWNVTKKPCASQFFTCAAGAPSQVRCVSIGVLVRVR